MATGFSPAGGGEPHGYDEFIASVEAIVIGRKTFDKVLTFPEWPYGKKPRDRAKQPPNDFRSGARSGAGANVWRTRAKSSGGSRPPASATLYIDGGITLQRFLREG